MAGGKFDFGQIGQGRSALPAAATVTKTEAPPVESTAVTPKATAKPAKKNSAKSQGNAGESRTKPIKFYVTPTEEQRFIDMLDGRSASKFLYQKFQELLS